MSDLMHDFLCLDVGNSLTKYARMQSPTHIIEWGDLKSNAQLVQLLSKVQDVYIASVGHKEKLSALLQVLDGQKRQYELLSTSYSYPGLTCAYSHPQRFGLDRWLAMIGARSLSIRPLAVMDFGTAITCDFVAPTGQHLGGWICPGIQLMRQSLSRQTAGVTVNQAEWYTGEVGQNTEDCVDSGCLQLASGLIDRARHYLAARFDDHEIFICGGDGKLISAQVSGAFRFKPELIFIGMAECVSKKA
ncbi:type III pantothenate kinase [Lacimicrobium sp. SS2-24]|uniref:type III pantothenate kinase n=1 Tax=Lacimicrobium sp. SS2-24 TaxID=2005569 RepID=UPI00143AAA85|nr:type III pantothenate kinase [Lacimicrobium sp. SS2-24]